MFKRILRGIGKGVAAAAGAAVPAVLTVVTPEGLVNLGAGFLMKHAMPRLSNRAIPYVNVVGSVAFDVVRNVLDNDPATGVSLAVTEGVRRAASAWATHLSIKEPLLSKVQIKGQTL